MKSFGLIFVLALAGSACGDDGNNTPDAPNPPHMDAATDSSIDAPSTPTTLTSYVIDLVQHHTNNTDLPRAFTEFSTLPDPDQTNNNLAAYASLFP